MLTENDLCSAADPVQSFQWMGSHDEGRSSNIRDPFLQISAARHCFIRHCKIIPTDIQWS